MKETKNYTGADIERYYRGELSAAEMHDLEAAALADPMLADALDGYTFTQTPATDLAALRQKLQERIQEKDERKAVFLMNTRWMRAAAVFIMLVGAGWLMFTVLNPKQDSVATATTAPAEDVVATPMPDSTSVIYNTPPASSRAAQTDETERTPQSIETYSAPAPTLRRAMPGSAPMAAMVDSSAVAAEASAAKERIDGYVSGANVLRNEEKAFKKETTARGDSINNLNIVLKPNNLLMDEVVVNKNKRASAAYDIRKRGNVVIDSLEPAEGWTNYDDYIASNIQQPTELKDKPVRGEVELAFDVNAEGEAVNITVVRSLCDRCDKEAIRLLKEGPKWKKANKKGKIKIAF